MGLSVREPPGYERRQPGYLRSLSACGVELPVNELRQFLGQLVKTGGRDTALVDRAESRFQGSTKRDLAVSATPAASE